MRENGKFSWILNAAGVGGWTRQCFKVNGFTFTRIPDTRICIFSGHQKQYANHNDGWRKVFTCISTKLSSFATVIWFPIIFINFPRKNISRLLGEIVIPLPTYFLPWALVPALCWIAALSSNLAPFPSIPLHPSPAPCLAVTENLHPVVKSERRCNWIKKHTSLRVCIHATVVASDLTLLH